MDRGAVRLGGVLGARPRAAVGRGGPGVAWSREGCVKSSYLAKATWCMRAKGLPRQLWASSAEVTDLQQGGRERDREQRSPRPSLESK